jgi:hypothetical protein
MGLLDFDPKSERIALAHRRLKAAYDRREGAEVPVVDLGVPPGRFAPRERIEDLDKLLAHAAGWANSLAAVESDWPPHIDTFAGVVLVAEAFGCEVVWTPGADPWTRPALAEISGVWGLKPRRPAESPMIRRLSEWVDYAQRKLGTDLPMWTMDVQSPFSVAAHVVDPMELMTACITDPKAVHHLVGMITDYSIEMMRQHLAQMEHPGFPGRNYPSISENIGAASVRRSAGSTSTPAATTGTTSTGCCRSRTSAPRRPTRESASSRIRRRRRRSAPSTAPAGG